MAGPVTSSSCDWEENKNHTSSRLESQGRPLSGSETVVVTSKSRNRKQGPVQGTTLCKREAVGLIEPPRTQRAAHAQSWFIWDLEFRRSFWRPGLRPEGRGLLGWAAVSLGVHGAWCDLWGKALMLSAGWKGQSPTNSGPEEGAGPGRAAEGGARVR